MQGTNLALYLIIMRTSILTKKLNLLSLILVCVLIVMIPFQRLQADMTGWFADQIVDYFVGEALQKAFGQKSYKKIILTKVDEFYENSEFYLDSSVLHMDQIQFDREIRLLLGINSEQWYCYLTCRRPSLKEGEEMRMQFNLLTQKNEQYKQQYDSLLKQHSQTPEENSASQLVRSMELIYQQRMQIAQAQEILDKKIAQNDEALKKMNADVQSYFVQFQTTKLYSILRDEFVETFGPQEADAQLFSFYSRVYARDKLLTLFKDESRLRRIGSVLRPVPFFGKVIGSNASPALNSVLKLLNDIVKGETEILERQVALMRQWRID